MRQSGPIWWRLHSSPLLKKLTPKTLYETHLWQLLQVHEVADERIHRLDEHVGTERVVDNHGNVAVVKGGRVQYISEISVTCIRTPREPHTR